MENIEQDAPVINQNQKCELYVVSPKKFTILFFCTMGLYSLYWSYKNWSLYNSSTNANIWPFARAFFDIFFIHSLCNKLLTCVGSMPTTKEHSNIELQATRYVILTVVGRIFDQVSTKGVGMPYSYFVSILVLPFTFQALLTIQIRINQHMGDELGHSNTSLTWVSYIWIVLGVLLWAIIVLGGIAILIGI
tara:strand:+ start:1151 stop:1723 length:573 start_codon:yes stop_codon:yes gene_type:complete